VDRNLLLAFALSFAVLSLWSMLYRDHAPQEVIEAPAVAGGEATAEGPAAVAGESAPSRYPELSTAQSGSAEPRRRVEEPAGAAVAPAPDAVEVTVDQSLYRATLSSRGAALTSWELISFTDRHGDPIHLVAPDDFAATAATQFDELERGDLARETWRVVEQTDTVVRFEITRDGVTVTKSYDFSDDGYHFRLHIDVSNASDAEVAPAFLVEWPIRERQGNDFREESAAAMVDGSVKNVPLAGLGKAGLFGRFTGAKDGEPKVFDGEIDWAGVQTPYFLSAAFPDQPASAHARFIPVELGHSGAVQLYFDPVVVPTGQAASREYRAYLGPKEVGRLEAFAPSAVQSVGLGWSFIAPMTRAFVWLLAVFHSFIPNYGWAIIVLTVVVRLAMTPLTVKQMRSMERMRRIQPKIKEIQEKYKDDRQKQSEAMMSLYRQEKVNPLGGCLPMVLQLPVFIGLFYALRSSIQLRQAPFIGWIDDLSAPDLLFTIPGIDFPFRVLPLLMGASMFVQQKITPMQTDPAQARMMLIMMPGMMTVISYTFPSGLVLYWMMSNVLAIAQQLWIGRHMKPVEG
jgi:YidC/Oxa1 family membrane protein insertase